MRGLPPRPEKGHDIGEWLGDHRKVIQKNCLVIDDHDLALRERYGVARVVLRSKEHYSKPATDALIDDMAKEVQVAIAAVGG